MAELYPSDAELNALSGTADNEQEILYVTAGESPYYTSFYKMLHRLLKVSRRAGDLRVFKDGDLTFGVRAGRYFNGDTAVNYAEASAQALTNNATNYVYLTAAGVLTVNTTGFPVPSTTPHIPLATILTAAGAYDGRDVSEGGDITDYRGRGFLQVASAATAALLNEMAAFFAATDITGAEAEELTNGSTTTKHKHAVAGLADAVQDLLPNLLITAGAEAADTRLITIQARDAANNDLIERVRFRLWISTVDYGAPNATGNTYALVSGTALRTLTANADYEVISASDGPIGGLVEFDLTISGAATRYIMAEIDGRIYSSGAITWAA